MRSFFGLLGVTALAITLTTPLAGCSAPAPAVAPTPEVVPTAAPSASASAAPDVPSAPTVARKTCPAIGGMPPQAGSFWQALVQPLACFTLVSVKAGKLNTDDAIIIESYDARHVGDADVARLRYTRSTTTEQSDAGGREHLPAQIAVTKSGVYFLEKKVDDAAIGKALRGGPAYVDPPKPVEPSKANKYQFVRKMDSSKGPLVCVGHELPKDAACTEHCEATVCLSPTAGFVFIEGAAAPDFGTFVRDGFQPQTPAAPAK